MRLIDADALIKTLEAQDYSNAPDTLEEWTPQDMTNAEIFDINNAPTVDPVKHGQWVVNDNHHTCRCSCCESVELTDWALEQAKYCPHCGSRNG